MVHIIKSLVLSLVTVTACLLSGFLHIGDHTGDRAAIVLVAGLILTANIQAELNLGKINYLIWQDGFNLMLIVITLLALAQTVYVHRIWRHEQQQARALSIDRICTMTIICFLFPLEVFGYGLTAFPPHFALGAALCAIAPVVSALIILAMVAKAERRRATNERLAVAAIQEANLAASGDPLREVQLRRAFKAFDRDKTGGLTADELRRLLRAAYPTAGSQAISNATQVVKERFFAEARLSADDWIAAHAEVHPMLISQAKGCGASRGLTAQHLLGRSTQAFAVGKKKVKTHEDTPAVGSEADPRSSGLVA